MAYPADYGAAGAAVQAAVAALDETLANFEAAARLAPQSANSLDAWLRETAGQGRGIIAHAHQLAQTPGYAAAVNAAIAGIGEAKA